VYTILKRESPTYNYIKSDIVLFHDTFKYLQKTLICVVIN